MDYWKSIIWSMLWALALAGLGAWALNTHPPRQPSRRGGFYWDEVRPTLTHVTCIHDLNSAAILFRAPERIPPAPEFPCLHKCSSDDRRISSGAGTGADGFGLGCLAVAVECIMNLSDCILSARNLQTPCPLSSCIVSCCIQWAGPG